MFMLRKLKAAGLHSQELLIVYKGYIRALLEYAVPFPRGTQVLLNSKSTRLRTFRSEWFFLFMYVFIIYLLLYMGNIIISFMSVKHVFDVL